MHSQQAYERECETPVKNIRHENETQGKELWHLRNKPFACEADALKAAQRYDKKLRNAMAEEGLTIGDQKRRPTKSPTVRRVFQKFESVLMLYAFESDRLKLIPCELTKDQDTVIRRLGKRVEKMFF